MSVYEQIFQIAENVGWTPDAVLTAYWIFTYVEGIFTVVFVIFLSKVFSRLFRWLRSRRSNH